MPRQARGRFKVYGAYTTLGWRVVRSCGLEEGRKMVSLGDWEEVQDYDGGVAFQLRSPDRAVKGDYDILSMHAPASISMQEMQVNAGCMGRSRTFGMSEDRRLERRDPEDAIERTIAKVKVWPHVGPRKGDINRAWALAGL
ncbi:MAG: hypothetical protein JST28_09195 [Acidobacteria bacterium]|nr:hypothetical protein [Acidobacteriota bacterium]